MHSLIKLLKRLVLVCGIVAAAGVNLWMVLGLQQRLDAIVSMHEQLQRSGLGQVTSLRGIPQVCGKTDYFFGDMYYLYAVDVARIPDTFWESRAARGIWYRGPDRYDEFHVFKFEMPPDDLQACPVSPGINSSRFFFALVSNPADDLGPNTPSSLKAINVMAYDTETSRLYWVYQRFSGFP
ncbi:MULTISPECIES: hypothetical protein [unclassified Xanthomonas]|uniref:hypothetical protein n=1 Tax=unclassified Xanthomonas TaxID=2643310 RepID=UPI0016206533|nr:MULTISPECIES: hypothetical protein [unclassified Xanthomonas]MBB4133023.1 hypothetical protein [Xanthomonas sp. 3075]MBB5866039.1 hypothetical protein [Xanthomonas sp. 3058]